MKGYYIDTEGKKVELFDDTLYLNFKNLVELVLPENCIECTCHHNQLTKLIVNDKCRWLYCYNNKLTELVLPQSCINCDCEYNDLTKLIISNNCKKLYCRTNNFSYQIEQLLISNDPIKIQLANNLQK